MFLYKKKRVLLMQRKTPTYQLESTSKSMPRISQLIPRRTRQQVEVVGSNPIQGEVFKLRPLTQKPVILAISDHNEGELLKNFFHISQTCFIRSNISLPL